MSRSCRSHRVAVLLVLAASAVYGCSTSRDPQPVRFDPATCARQALERHDADKNGVLSAEEWRSSPGLARAAARVDMNKDGQITPQEIETRLSSYRSQSPYVVLMLHVRRQGKPVPGAEVKVLPDPMLGAGFSTYAGTSDDEGRVSVAREDGSLRDVLAPGLYTVDITASGSTTRQGLEVSSDAAGSRSVVLQVP